MKNPKIMKLFLDVSMAMGHDGLIQIAAKSKIKVSELEADDLLMFLNVKGDKMKILGAQGKVLGYLRMPKKRPIMKEALMYIPQTFGADGFNYDAACRVALEKRFGK